MEELVCWQRRRSRSITSLLEQTADDFRLGLRTVMFFTCLHVDDDVGAAVVVGAVAGGGGGGGGGGAPIGGGGSAPLGAADVDCGEWLPSRASATAGDGDGEAPPPANVAPVPAAAAGDAAVDGATTTVDEVLDGTGAASPGCTARTTVSHCASKRGRNDHVPTAAV